MQQTLRNAISNNYANNLPFVVYARPGSMELTALFQNQSGSFVQKHSDRGFIFAPFTSEHETLFIPLEQSTVITYGIELPETKEGEVDVPIDASDKNAHIALVNKAVEEIVHTDLEKVVISRAQELRLHNFDPVAMVKELLEQDSQVFRYAWFHPVSGLWVGATPEVLLTISDNNFKTMSLAGTRSALVAEKRAWTTKEYHEQKVVTDSIAENLEPFSESLQISEVTTVRAGNLEHLRTDFEGVLKEGYRWSQLANTLHPTPAVCGSPQEKALDFILNNENYNRTYYTGYLGPIDLLKGEKNLYVNLRCMKIQNNTATLFTGGGITEESDPTAEWEETCKKQHAMLKLLRQFL